MTTYALHRVEPISRQGDPGEGLAAVVADPLWMLARQRQYGELTGEDAGSPIRVDFRITAHPLDGWSADGATIRDGGIFAWRPMAGVEWTPEIYPRTTLSTDAQFVPELGPTAAETTRRWLFTWGVRYRAFAWGAIELAVKHRQNEQLDDAAVMLRMSARLGSGTRL